MLSPTGAPLGTVLGLLPKTPPLTRSVPFHQPGVALRVPALCCAPTRSVHCGSRTGGPDLPRASRLPAWCHRWGNRKSTWSRLSQRALLRDHTCAAEARREQTGEQREGGFTRILITSHLSLFCLIKGQHCGIHIHPYHCGLRTSVLSMSRRTYGWHDPANRQCKQLIKAKISTMNIDCVPQ